MISYENDMLTKNSDSFLANYNIRDICVLLYCDLSDDSSALKIILEDWLNCDDYQLVLGLTAEYSEDFYVLV